MSRRSVWDAAGRFIQAAIVMGTVIIASGALQPAAAQSNVRVGVDEGAVVPLVKSPAAVIVGNPLIADATVQNGNLLVVMGKNYGSTNIIALDGAGEEIANFGVNVGTSGNFEVSLHMGGERETLNCTPTCEYELNVGDGVVHFEETYKEITSKVGLSDAGQQAPSGE